MGRQALSRTLGSSILRMASVSASDLGSSRAIPMRLTDGTALSALAPASSGFSASFAMYLMAEMKPSRALPMYPAVSIQWTGKGQPASSMTLCMSSLIMSAGQPLRTKTRCGRWSLSISRPEASLSSPPKTTSFSWIMVQAWRTSSCLPIWWKARAPQEQPDTECIRRNASLKDEKAR